VYLGVAAGAASRQAELEREMQALRDRKEREERWTAEKKAILDREQKEQTEWIVQRREEMRVWILEQEKTFAAEMDTVRSDQQSKKTALLLEFKQEIDQAKELVRRLGPVPCEYVVSLCHALQYGKYLR